MKSRLTAAFLALFFGMFGVHKFYLRNPGAGVLYLFIFFMTSRIFPFSGILALVDAVRLFIMSDNEFDRRYNKGVANGERRDRRNRRTGRKPNRSQSRSRRGREVRASKAPVRQRVNPFKKSGIRKYKEYDLDEAIVDFKKGLEIEPSDIALHFNIACAYSLTEQKDSAFYHMSKAVELGYKDFEKIQTHDDLAFIRIQPEFEDFKKAGYRLQAVPQAEEQEEVKDDKLLAQLNKLKELREKGMITDMDYNIETRKLLKR